MTMYDKGNKPEAGFIVPAWVAPRLRTASPAEADRPSPRGDLSPRWPSIGHVSKPSEAGAESLAGLQSKRRFARRIDEGESRDSE